jgi:ribosomal protein RSM22 (predicted rRNA methylase)
MGPFNRRAFPKTSPIFDKVIRQLTEREYPLSMSRLSEAIRELSQLFTRGRGALPSGYMDEVRFAAAYLSYFLPVNASKVQVLLDELPLEADLSAKTDGRCSVLDVGSGPGTASLAVLDWVVQKVCTDANLHVVSVDRSETALRNAVRLWEGYCREAGVTRATLRTCASNLEKTLKGSVLNTIEQGEPYDLIILANCLNELFGDSVDAVSRRAELVGELLPLLQPHGSFMIIEPALRQISRELHQVRDHLLQSKICTVYSPCLHEQACPALIHPDDWCHEERTWEPPMAIKQIDDEVGFIKDALKFSYLMLRTDGLTITPRSPNTFRVVSELRELKGDTRAWLCNELGRSEVGKLERAKSATNAPWEDCQRGTIVKIEGLRRKGGGTLTRIPEDARVEIIRSI